MIKKFLLEIGYNEILLLQGLSAVLNLIPSQAIRDHAARTIKNTKFRSWLEGARSRILVLNSEDAEVNGDIKALVSIFSFALHQMFEKEMPGTVLTYFCGQFPENKPKDMAIDLLGQVITKSLGHRMKIPSRDEWQEFNFQDLVTTLVNCIQTQCGEGPVYCIIDSCSFYEDQKRASKMQSLLYSVANVTVFSTPHTFKLLVTSPIKCTSFDQYGHGGEDDDIASPGRRITATDEWRLWYAVHTWLIKVDALKARTDGHANCCVNGVPIYGLLSTISAFSWHITLSIVRL